MLKKTQLSTWEIHQNRHQSDISSNKTEWGIKKHLILSLFSYNALKNDLHSAYPLTEHC